MLKNISSKGTYLILTLSQNFPPNTHIHRTLKNLYTYTKEPLPISLPIPFSSQKHTYLKVSIGKQGTYGVKYSV